MKKPMRGEFSGSSELFIVSNLLSSATCEKKSFYFDNENRMFSFLCDRFCWELTEDLNEDFLFRNLSAICFFDVKGVKCRGFNFEDDENELFEFLEMYFEINGNRIDNEMLGMFETSEINDKKFLRIVFKNDKEIRIQIDELKCKMHDIEGPQPSGMIPSFDFDFSNKSNDFL